MSQHQGGLDRRTACQLVAGILLKDYRFHFQPLSRDTPKPELTLNLAQWSQIVVQYEEKDPETGKMRPLYCPVPVEEIWRSLNRENAP